MTDSRKQTGTETMQNNTANRRNSARRTLIGLLLSCTALTPGMALAQQAETAASDDTIIVTTQRRAENILDVPYNITVVSGQAIADSITLDSAELLRSIPGVGQINQDPRSIQFNSIHIRGLNVDSAAFGDFLLGSVSTVSTYINETPVFANLALIDLDRVEVERGPQATLYGSGALGGTVKYFARKPQFDEVSGTLMATGSTVKGSSGLGYSTGGILNASASDTFALRINVLWQDYPGITDYRNLYVLDGNGVPVQPKGLFARGYDSAQYTSKKDADDYQSLYARASARWAPNGNVDFVASYFYQNDDSGGRRQPSQGADGLGVPYGRYENGAVIKEPAHRTLNMGSLESNVDMGFATLTSATSYYKNDGNSETDNTGFFANNLAQFYYSTYFVFPRPLYTAKRTFEDKSFVQELRLVSADGGPIDYVFGGFYQDQTRGATQASDLVGFQAWADAFFAPADFVFTDNVFTFARKERYREVAVFGEVTAHLNERFKVTGGLRYFDNRSRTNTFVRAGLYTFFNGQADTTFTAKDNKLLYRFNAAYSFGDDDLFYATISKGYRRGGSNGVPTVGQFANNPAWLIFRSDTALNYELGVKGKAGGLRYDLNAFYIDWNNPQFNTSTPNGFFFAVANADKARSKGLEAEISGSSSDGRFNYDLGYTYVDANLTRDFVAPPGFGQTTGTLVARKGAPLPGVAKHSINVAADYSIPVSNSLNFISRVDGAWQSSTQNVLDQGVFQSAKFGDFAIIDLTFTLAAERWNTSLFIKNVGNTLGTTGAFTPAAFGPNPAADFFGSNSRSFITLPRTFGLAFNVNF